MIQFEELSQKEQEVLITEVMEWAKLKEKIDWDYEVYIHDRNWWEKFHRKHGNLQEM